MITKEMKEVIKDIKIEAISDFGAFQELEAFAAELLNSNDSSNKLLALRIQNRLNENPNYQTFTQRFKMEQEIALEKQEKSTLDKRQEIRNSNAASNIESKKKEETKKAEEERKTAEAFNKLNQEQQKMIIELEKSFKPELQQELRSFLLNEEKSTPEHFASLMNKEIGNNVVKIEKSDDGKPFITVDSETTTEEAKEVSQKSEKVAQTAIQVGNQVALVSASSTILAAEVKVVSNELKNNMDAGLKFLNIDQTKLTDETKKHMLIDTVFNNISTEVLPKYNKYLDELKGIDEGGKIEFYNRNFINNIIKELKEKNIDLNDPENKKQIAEKLADLNFHKRIKDELVKSITQKLGIEVEFDIAKKDIEEIDLDLIDGPTQKSTPKKEVKETEVEVYDPKIRSQNETTGVAAEMDEKIKQQYGNSEKLQSEKNQEKDVYIHNNHNQ